jgi:hypothetical protein
VKAPPTPPLHEKITLYKIDRKKVVASGIKKDELKN